MQGAALLAGLSLVAAACGSSSKKSSTGSTGSSSGSTSTKGNTASAPGVTVDSITVGLVYPGTGAAASNYVGIDKAFEARIAAENANGGVFGRKINVVPVDDTSTAAANLTAVQKVVQQNNPFVVADNSAFAFGGYRYLVDQKIPMISPGVDGPEYADPGNEYLLPMSGNVAPNSPTSTITPQFMKDHGVTKGAGLGYSISPSSAKAATNFAKSGLPAVGLPVGYVNTTIPFGGENVAPVVLAMKSQGIDGAYLAMDIGTNFAIINAAAQNQANMKAIIMATGYGQDLLEQPTSLATAGKGGVYMAAAYTPIELNTPATQKFQSILKQYANYTGVPSLNWFYGYATAGLLIDGLNKAGRNPTRQGLVDAVRTFDNYDAGGLLCSGVTFTTDTYGKLDTNKQSCSYFVKVVDGKFVVEGKATGHLVPNAG